MTDAATQPRLWRRVWRKLRWVMLGGTVAAIAFVVYVYSVPFPMQWLERDSLSSTQFVDRHGRPLRDVLSERQGRHRWVELNEVSPHVIEATLAAEDGRFWAHPGVDVLAIGRAGWDNISNRRIVSGASTVTQQVVRLVRPRPRTWKTKFDEAVWALRLEQALSKREILCEYLNRAPYGNQLFGIEAAARMYFDKPAAQLSVAEAALLSGLPQSPSRLNPYRSTERLAKRQRWILGRLLKLGKITDEEHRLAVAEELVLLPRRYDFEAPHFVDYVRGVLPDAPARVETTLDLPLQKAVRAILRTHVERLRRRHVTNAAVVVLDNPTGEVLAMVGSVDFDDQRHAGQVNGATAWRPPGSTLKPFTYAVALEKGFTPATVIPDVETHFPSVAGDYHPRNYDGRYYGPVRLRAALANSLNVPAARVLAEIGANALLRRLRRLGLTGFTKSASHYGLGLTLGDGEVRLLELTNAYATLARMGLYRPTVAVRGDRPTEGDPVRVFRPEVCYQIADILSDRAAARMTFGRNGPFEFAYRVAVKTGTSHDYRDNWTVGFTPRHTVAVWVGNFDAHPMQATSGITGAGPIFREIVQTLYAAADPSWYPRPANIVETRICRVSGKRPCPLCPTTAVETFAAGTVPTSRCDQHVRVGDRVVLNLPPEYTAWQLAQGQTPVRQPTPTTEDARLRIVHPNPRDRFIRDPDLPMQYQTIRFQAVAPSDVRRVDWYLDGRKLDTTSAPYHVRWPMTPGLHRLHALDDRGRTSPTVEFQVR